MNSSGRKLTSEDLVRIPGAEQAGIVLSQGGERIELGQDLPVLDTLVVDPAEWLERRYVQLIDQCGLRGRDETILKSGSLVCIVGGFILNSSPLGIAAFLFGVLGYGSGIIVGQRLTGRLNLSPVGNLSIGDTLDLMTTETRDGVQGTSDEAAYLNEAERSELWLIENHGGLVAEALANFKPSARLLAYLKIRRLARNRKTIPKPQEIVHMVGEHRLLKSLQPPTPSKPLSPSTALSHLDGKPRRPAAPLPLKETPTKAHKLLASEPRQSGAADASASTQEVSYAEGHHTHVCGLTEPAAPLKSDFPPLPSDPNAGLRIGLPEAPVDLAKEMGSRLANLIIFAKPRTGKGFTVSLASKFVSQTFPDCEVWLIDPRSRPSEQSYWQHIPESQRLHFDVSGFLYNAELIASRINSFMIRFEASTAQRRLLIIDELKMLSRKLGAYASVRRLVEYVISLSSSGSVGQVHEFLGRFAWLCSQDPQLTSLGFRNAGDRGSFEIEILFDLEKGTQMHLDLRNTGLIPNLPNWDQLQALASQSESGRFFYSTTTDSFRSIVLYGDRNNLLGERQLLTPRRESLPPKLSTKAAKLQHLSNSFNAPPVSPAYQSEDDLKARIDQLWETDDPSHRTDVIDRAISYMNASDDPERRCLADLLEALKRKAVQKAGNEELSQISMREITGLHWTRKWSEEYQVLRGRKKDDIYPWVERVIALGFLHPITQDEFHIRLS